MKNLLWVVTFAICSSVCAQAQTIADVARRERAARQAEQNSVSVSNANLKKKVVITGEDKSSSAATTKAAPAAAAAPATTPATTATGNTGGDEKAWREKFEAARTDLRRAENQVALAQLEMNSANRDYLTRSYDPDGRGLQAIAASKQKLADANAAVNSAQTKLSQLQEDLRRSGAPAGWGR
jgi:hypothetical protein